MKKALKIGDCVELTGYPYGLGLVSRLVYGTRYPHDLVGFIAVCADGRGYQVPIGEGKLIRSSKNR